MGKSYPQSARKHFDKFTSEISPSYENSMKSYLTLVDRRDLGTRENICLI